MAPILTVRHFSTGYGKRQVLFDVTLEVMPGEVLLIAGGNGSGKSTLLKAIYGLLPPWNNKGTVLFHPEPSSSPLRTFPAVLNLPKGLAYLPQNNAVFDDLTVEDNLRIAGHALRSRPAFVARRAEVLASLPALNRLLCCRPGQMSGGERQIAALAMILLHHPKLLLLDEPTAGLDPSNSQLVLSSLQNANRENGLTIIVVEHRRRECAVLGGRICQMKLGKLEMGVTTREIIEDE